jgi:hypothetical protein
MPLWGVLYSIALPNIIRPTCGKHEKQLDALFSVTVSDSLLPVLSVPGMPFKEQRDTFGFFDGSSSASV